MSYPGENKENFPPTKRRIPWFRHHNPGTRYKYDGPRRPLVKILSSVTVVPPKPVSVRPSTPPRPKPETSTALPPQRPKATPPVPETPRRPRPSGTPRRLETHAQHERHRPRSHHHTERGRRHHKRSSTRPRTPPRQHRRRTPPESRFRPPPPRSPSPSPRIVLTRDRGMRPDIPWVAPRRLNLIKPSRPRFHDSTGRDPRSRGVQVIVTVPPPEAPVRRSTTPPTPRMSPVPSPVRPLPPTPPSIKVPGPQPRSKIVYYRGSLVPGRPRRHISLAYYPREDA